MMKPKDYRPDTMTIDWSKVIIEPKFDGIRACFKDGALLSYSGKPIFNAEPILKELKHVRLAKGDFIDGELWSKSGGWEKTISVMKASKSKRELEDIRFYMFDLVIQRDHVALIQRKKTLRHLWLTKKKQWEYLQHVEWDLAESQQNFFQTYQMHLRQGYEGTMIKNMSSRYEWGKRSGLWLRLKPTQTEEVIVVGMKEGLGKYKETLGALVCRDKNGKKIHVSGMSDAQRAEFWKRRYGMKGATVEVKFFKRTQKGTMYAAQFVRERVDK